MRITERKYSFTRACDIALNIKYLSYMSLQILVAFHEVLQNAGILLNNDIKQFL